MVGEIMVPPPPGPIIFHASKRGAGPADCAAAETDIKREATGMKKCHFIRDLTC
jgi:hypothetical protein